ncbi:MAG TPA: hypothetical protein VHB21_00275 [Minicystis sp.]|nr:hypothetical protein [Minicystis sp.]
MRRWLLSVAASATLVFAAACEPPAPAVAPGAPVAVVPMRLVQRNVDPPHLLVELKADGTVQGPDGQLLGKLAGTKITEGKKDLVTVQPDGTIVSAESTRKMKFNGDGDITDEKGTIKIGSDGTVVLQDANGDLNRTPMRFEGFNQNGHRAAEFVLVLVAKHLGANLVDLGF